MTKLDWAKVRQASRNRPGCGRRAIGQPLGPHTAAQTSRKIPYKQKLISKIASDLRSLTGRTKTEVQDKLKALYADLDMGITRKAGDSAYTLRQAAEDWLRNGLDGRAAKTIKKNENVLAPILEAIGSKKLRELNAADVRQALTKLAARYSTAAVTMGHNALTRAIRHAELLQHHGRPGERPRPDYPVAALCHAGLWELRGFTSPVPAAHGDAALLR